MTFDLANHLLVFPHSAVQIHEGRLYGVWVVGNDYRAKRGYYGEYPPSYLRRIRSLLSGDHRILHLFAGSVEPLPGEVTFDVNPSLGVGVVGDAAKLSMYFSEPFDLILADPPYSPKDAEKYGVKMVASATVTRECAKILTPGGLLVWLSTRKPMYKNDQWELAGLVLLDSGTNRLFRGVTFLRRTKCPT